MLEIINNIKEKTKKYNAYIYYTLIFTITAIAVFWIFIKTGKSFIWQNDGFNQHYLILNDFNVALRNIFNNGMSLFSWNLGLGLDVIGQYSYYILGDIFSYLSLLFSMDNLKYAYQILILFRIYCVGIAFIIYCRYNKKDDFNTIIGAIIYTFSGYILAASIRHPYFTNPAIMLPFVFLGIDKILKEDKYIYFTVSIAILAIMNYYFLYMITILAVIYAIVKFITDFKDQGINVFWTKFGKTVFHYIVGVMVAGIILLPTAYTFLNSDRTGVSYTYYDMEYYEKLFFMQHGTPFWSAIYVSIISTLMLPIAVLNLKKNKENINTLINIAICVLILVVPFLGSVMNGFSFQSNRWCFAYTFYMAYMVVINLRKNLKYNKKEIFSILALSILYIILSIFATNVDRNFILMTIVTMGLLIATIVYRKYSIQTRKICKVLLLLITCINIAFSAQNLYSRNGKNYADEFLKMSNIEEHYQSNRGEIAEFDKAIDYIKERDDTFYRIGTTVYSYNNMSAYYDYNGLNSFLSLGNGYVTRFAKELLVLGNTNTISLNELDARTKLTTFLGCKYYIVPVNKTSYVPYGYKLKKEYVATKVYENENNLPIGIFYDSYISKEDYEKLPVLEKEQALLETATVENISKIEKTNINYNKDLAETIKDTSKEVNYTILNETFYLKEKIFYINFDEVENCELYLYFDNLEYDSTDKYYVKVRYKDVDKYQKVEDSVASPYYLETPNILFNLGYMDKHSGMITVELTGDGNYTYDNLKLLAVPIDKYEQSIAKLKETPFEVQEVGEDFIKGNISNSRSGILQISTSYSRGWKALVDGKEAEVINVNTGFIGIPLNEGEHEIYLTYSTPWLRVGIVVSVLGILMLMIIIIKQKLKLSCEF